MVENVLTETVTRCQQNSYHLNKNKIYKTIINHQMECSKAIFNTGLYCQRIWFSRVLKIIFNYYVDNLDTYLEQFSPEDKSRLLNHLIFKKDVNNINKILGYVKLSEKTLITELIKKAKRIIEGCELIEPNFIDTNKITYTYDFQKTVDLLNTTSIDKFKDEYGDISDFVEKIKKSFMHKIENQKKPKKAKPKKKTKPKKKEAKSTKNKKPSTKTPATQPESKSHLIPCSYINNDILESYVKNIESYKMIGSQVAQQTLKKLDESFKSFFALKKTGAKANAPKYLKPSERYV